MHASRSDDDYGFEYSDDDQEEEDVNIENRYYNAKGDLADDMEAALAGFEEVVSMEDEKGEWGFKVIAAARAGMNRGSTSGFLPPTLTSSSLPHVVPSAGLQADGQATLQARQAQGDDDRLQANAHLHQKRCHAQLLGESH